MLGESERNRLGRQIRNDFEQIEIAFQVRAVDHLAVDAQGADDFVQMDDRHADESDVRIAAARAGAVEELRLQRNVRNDPGAARERDLPGDPLAEPVAPALLRLLGESVRSLDEQQVAAPQRHRAAQQPHLAVENLEHPAQQRRDILLAQHGLADLVQHCYFEILAAVHVKTSPEPERRIIRVSQPRF